MSRSYIFEVLYPPSCSSFYFSRAPPQGKGAAKGGPWPLTVGRLDSIRSRRDFLKTKGEETHGLGLEEPTWPRYERGLPTEKHFLMHRIVDSCFIGRPRHLVCSYLFRPLHVVIQFFVYIKSLHC